MHLNRYHMSFGCHDIAANTCRSGSACGLVVAATIAIRKIKNSLFAKRMCSKSLEFADWHILELPTVNSLDGSYIQPSGIAADFSTLKWPQPRMILSLFWLYPMTSKLAVNIDLQPSDGRSITYVKYRLSSTNTGLLQRNSGMPAKRTEQTPSLFICAINRCVAMAEVCQSPVQSPPKTDMSAAELSRWCGWGSN